MQARPSPPAANTASTSADKTASQDGGGDSFGIHGHRRRRPHYRNRQCQRAGPYQVLSSLRSIFRLRIGLGQNFVVCGGDEATSGVDATLAAGTGILASGTTPSSAVPTGRCTPSVPDAAPASGFGQVLSSLRSIFGLAIGAALYFVIRGGSWATSDVDATPATGTEVLAAGATPSPAVAVVVAGTDFWFIRLCKNRATVLADTSMPLSDRYSHICDKL